MIKLINLIPLKEDKKMESSIEKAFKRLGVRVSKTDAYKGSAGWTIDLVINDMGKYRDPFDIVNDYNDEKDYNDPELFDVDGIGGNKYRFYVKNYNKV